uniref:Integrin alpha-2 domain-containing protein n=1 Tax=Eptatretus burgeri TaxID=7764 RepID=A0A8C4QGZ5_EPTBU
MRARGVARGVRGSDSGSRFLQGRALRLLLGFGSLLGGLRAYNVELKRPLVFRGPNGTFFGYSVLAHHHGSRSWLLAGAPRSSSNFLEAQRPGAVYRCAVRSNPRRFCQEMHIGTRRARPCGRTCREERDDQWLGVSMVRQPQDDGFLVCAHRWKNVYYQTDHKLPLGACFLISKHSSTKHKKNYGEEHGSCQAGISSTFAQVSTSAPPITQLLTALLVPRYTRCGYCAGVMGQNFLQLRLRVSLYLIVCNVLCVCASLHMQVGSYFGAALCAVDLNSDGLSDLLVGAPMTSRARDEGRVHVYINRGNVRLFYSSAHLNDFGVVYIYHGNPRGLTSKHSQKIQGRNVSPGVRMFGQSISGGVDLDGNGYPDIAIGAFRSDVALSYHLAIGILFRRNLKLVEEPTGQRHKETSMYPCMNLEMNTKSKRESISKCKHCPHPLYTRTKVDKKRQLNTIVHFIHLCSPYSHNPDLLNV